MEKKNVYCPPQSNVLVLNFEGVICGSPDIPGAGGEGVDWE